jgi:lipooligosaccharide transport system permease protein
VPFFSFDPALAAAVWRRNLAVYRHTWVMNILPNFFEPLLYLLAMGVGLGAYLERGLSGPAYIAFIGPGLMTAAAMNGASFESTYNMFIKMNFSRLYDAYLGTPADVEDIVAGELLWAVTRSLIYGMGFFVVLLAFTAAGYPVLTRWTAALAPLVVALTGALFALIGQFFTARITAIDLYSYYFTLFITPLFLFSGIFYPVDRFPHGAAIAWWTPLYHAVRLMRGVTQGPLGVEHVIDAGWIVALSAVLLLAVPRAMRRRVLS